LEKRDRRYQKLLQNFQQLQEALAKASEKQAAREPSKKDLPSWIKPDVQRIAKTPGRKEGHAGVHR